MATSLQEFLAANPTYLGRANTSNRAKAVQQPVKQKGKGGFLTSLISEAGGAGGAAGGAALGATLGSVVPGIGTLIGGAVGAGIGGFAGGTAGRGVENKIRDNQNFLGAGGSARSAFGEGALTGALSGLATGASALKGLKAAGGLKGLSTAANGSDEALNLMSKQILNGGKKAGTSIAMNGMENPGLLSKTGGSLRTGVLNPKVNASPFGASQEAGLMKTAQDIGLKGSATNQYQQLPVKFNQITAQADDLLSKNTKTSTFTNLTNTVKQSSKDLPQFVNGDEKYTQSLVGELSDLSSKFKSNKISVSEVASAKKDLGSKMDGIFKKVAKGADLNPKEASRYSIWKALDNQIINMAPEAKALTLKQSAMYEMAPGLKAAANKTLGVPLLGVKSKSAERAVQAGQDFAGRALQNTGSAIGAVTGKGGQVLRQAKFQLPGNLMSALNEVSQPQEQPQDPGMDQTMQDPTMGENAPMWQEDIYGQQQPEPAMYSREQAMADIQRDPKNASTYMTLYKTFGEEASAAKAPKALSSAAKQQNALVGTGVNAVQNLRSMFQKDPSLIAKTGVPGRNVLGIGNRVLGLGEYEAMAQQAIDSVARLRTGAAMTPSEEQFYRRMVPQAGDSASTINQKLNELERYFTSFQNSESDTSATPDLQSALMQAGGY